jgi:hypothetical protein
MAGEREERDALNGLGALSSAIESLRAVLAKAFTADRAATGMRRVRRAGVGWDAPDERYPR